MLIHPDKCKLDRAAEAFQVVVKAYNDTKDPNYNDKCPTAPEIGILMHLA